MHNDQIIKDVMGWEWKNPAGGAVGFYCGEVFKGYAICYPNFLHDHNTAMKLVEKMFSEGWCHQSGQNKEGVYWFEFWRDDVYEDHKVLNKSLCHAICEAALMAKGIDIESKG